MSSELASTDVTADLSPRVDADVAEGLAQLLDVDEEVLAVFAVPDPDRAADLTAALRGAYGTGTITRVDLADRGWLVVTATG